MMLGQDTDTASPLKVRYRLRQILPALDLGKSQKDIYKMLETELGKPLCTVGKGVVKEEIEMFLMDRASQPQDDGIGETNVVAPVQVNGQVNVQGHAKRKLDVGGGQGASTGGKKSKQGPSQPPPAVEVRMSDALPGHYSISSRRFAGMSRYGGKLLVNIREFYEKDGKLAPGSKGISLTGPQFEELSKKTVKIDAALEKQPFEEAQFKLSENRFVTVREYSGKLLVDIREYYEKDLEMRPGKKGISLTVDEQWVNLKAVMPELLRQLAEEGGAGVAVSGHARDAPQNTSDVPSTRDDAPLNPKNPSNLALPTGQAGDAVLVSQGKYRLGPSKKFVTLENWKGQDVVDIREHYEEDGVWKPGKKGINLSTGQVQSILANLDAITDALSKQDQEYALELTNKRRVTISNYNGAWMVNIREYFELNSQLRPTKKGISLMPPQWSACREALTKIGQIMTT